MFITVTMTTTVEYARHAIAATSADASVHCTRVRREKSYMLIKTAKLSVAHAHTHTHTQAHS